MNRRRKRVLPPPGARGYIRAEAVEGENDLMTGRPLPPLVELTPAGPRLDTPRAIGPAGQAGAGPTMIPARDEIAALPRGVRMAFAARCVRRVMPLYWHAWPAATAEHRAAVATAARVAERSDADDAERAAASFAAAAAADAAGRAGADAAFDVARAAARATAADTPFAAALAVRAAADALAHHATIRTPLARYLRAIRRDYERITRLAAANGWTDDTPVPAAEFGPMWPTGAPDWWEVADGRPDDRLPVPTGETGE
jgi:hypothetical protein